MAIMDNIFAPVINWLSLNTWLPPLLAIFVSVAGIAFVFGPAKKQAKLAEKKFNLDQQIAIRNQDKETETGRNAKKAEVAKFDAKVKKLNLCLAKAQSKKVSSLYASLNWFSMRTHRNTAKS